MKPKDHVLVSAGFLLHASVRSFIFDLILFGMWRLWMCVTEKKNVLHYCSYSSPLIFPSPHLSSLLPHIPIILPSYCPFCTLPPSPSLLSLLLNLPDSPWCHCPFLSCRCGLICPLPLALSLSHSGLDKSPSLLPPVVLLSSLSISSLPSVFPSFCLLLRSFHIWINIHVSIQGDSADSLTPLTSLSRAADWHWCWFAACSCRAAKAEGSEAKGHSRPSRSGQWG